MTIIFTKSSYKYYSFDWMLLQLNPLYFTDNTYVNPKLVNRCKLLTSISDIAAAFINFPFNPFFSLLLI